MELPNPDLFYTQPTFRADSPDFAKAKGQTEWTLQTPGIELRLALDYYRFEAFAIDARTRRTLRTDGSPGRPVRAGDDDGSEGQATSRWT